MDKGKRLVPIKMMNADILAKWVLRFWENIENYIIHYVLKITILAKKGNIDIILINIISIFIKTCD